MKITNLTKYFGSNLVLDGLNLDIEKNSVFCLLGGSGVGKSTLLNAVAGLIDYDGEISPCKPSYVFQTDRLIPGITVGENLRYVMNEGDEREKLSKIGKFLNLAGLSGMENRMPKELSGGMAQRVSFLRAFLYQSDVVLMDEPFRSLDVSTKKVMADLLFSLLKHAPRTVIFVTHDIDEALYVGDRIAVLSGGKITFDVANDQKREDRKFYESSSESRAELARQILANY